MSMRFFLILAAGLFSAAAAGGAASTRELGAAADTAGKVRTPPVAAASGQSVVVADRKDVVHLKNKQVLKGTVLTEGPMGITILVDDKEEFKHADELARDKHGRFRVDRDRGKPEAVRFKVVQSLGQTIIQGRTEEAGQGTDEDIDLGGIVAGDEDKKKWKFYSSGTPKRSKKAKPPERKKFFASGAPPRAKPKGKKKDKNADKDKNAEPRRGAARAGGSGQEGALEGNQQLQDLMQLLQSYRRRRIR